MNKFILSSIFALGTMSAGFSAEMPAYVQVQIQNIDQQVSELQTQKKQYESQLQSLATQKSPEVSFKKDQLQSMLNRTNTQISTLQKEKTKLQKDYE